VHIGSLNVAQVHERKVAKKRIRARRRWNSGDPEGAPSRFILGPGPKTANLSTPASSALLSSLRHISIPRYLQYPPNKTASLLISPGYSFQIATKSISDKSYSTMGGGQEKTLDKERIAKGSTFMKTYSTSSSALKQANSTCHVPSPQCRPLELTRCPPVSDSKQVHANNGPTRREHRKVQGPVKPP